jgi:hypothetical protein
LQKQQDKIKQRQVGGAVQIEIQPFASSHTGDGLATGASFLSVHDDGTVGNDNSDPWIENTAAAAAAFNPGATAGIKSVNVTVNNRNISVAGC